MWPSRPPSSTQRNSSLGNTTLDLAGGTGEPALTVAERVGPAGSVVCTDLVRPMLAAAEAQCPRGAAAPT